MAPPPSPAGSPRGRHRSRDRWVKRRGTGASRSLCVGENRGGPLQGAAQQWDARPRRAGRDDRRGSLVAGA